MDTQTLMIIGIFIAVIVLVLKLRRGKVGDKISLTIVDGKRLFFRKGQYDVDSGLVDVFRRGRIRTYKQSTYNVNAEHLKNDPKGKLHLFIDSKTRQSFDIASTPQIDEKLRNKLDYLTERSFWYGLLASGYISLATRLIHICCGIGLYILIKTIIITVTKGTVTLP